MPANDRILLEQILEQKKSDIAPDASDSDFFELFAASEILKDYSLSYDELASGLVGGGNDGGVDGLWVFVNGELVREDSSLDNLRSNVEIELVLIQAKRSGGFQEEPINKLIAFTEHLFDLSKDISLYNSRYNEHVITIMSIFRNMYQRLISSFPVLNIRYIYATLGNEVHPNIREKSNDLIDKAKNLFSDINVHFTFLGASELLSIARKQPREVFQLRLAESPIIAGDSIAYVSLVKLTDYYNFISDDDGAIRVELFESNVRDFQGKTEVNKEISDTLSNRGPEDFWWLNNGITVLASNATQSGKVLTLEDPQIVNGLQTSRQIYEHFHSEGNAEDNRLLLVRVIVTQDEGSRDRIIKATNSQTYIPPASLKATDKIQRDIEQYLKTKGLHYDRRKNYYKNLGKPIATIVSIPQMAQALMAIILERPDTARARPSSLIKREEDYRRLFNADYPIQVYYSCIRLVRLVEAYLKSDPNLEQKDRNNIRFYVALELARELTGEKSPNINQLAEISEAEVNENLLSAATNRVLVEYNALGATDQIAKGRELLDAINQHWE